MFAHGALHTIPPGWRIVTNLHTLRMLQRAGFVRVPPEYGRPGRSAIGRVIHRYVREGDNAPDYRGQMFEHKGRSFRLQWSDGCFYPFVYEFGGAK